MPGTPAGTRTLWHRLQAGACPLAYAGASVLLRPATAQTQPAPPRAAHQHGAAHRRRPSPPYRYEQYAPCCSTLPPPPPEPRQSAVAPTSAWRRLGWHAASFGAAARPRAATAARAPAVVRSGHCRACAQRQAGSCSHVLGCTVAQAGGSTLRQHACGTRTDTSNTRHRSRPVPGIEMAASMRDSAACARLLPDPVDSSAT